MPSPSTVASAQAPAPRSCDVLHVLWSGHVGGIERQVAAVARTANEQRSRTHRVCFLDGRGPVGDALVDEGLAVRFHMNAGGSPVGLQRFGRYLRSARPSILHLHTAAIGTHLAALTALPRTPMVYTEHFPRVLDRAARYRMIYRLHRRRDTRFVALSDGMAGAMVSCGLDEARITVVPNAVCVPILDALPTGPTGATIGFVGRLVAAQRMDLLVDVVSELAARGTACEAIVVGDGPAREGLERHAAERGVGERLRFVGEQDDVVPWLDRLDGFLMTREAAVSSLASLEAMARGVPVVAMRARGGLGEIAEEGGLHLPDREISSAADAVERVLSSPAERFRLRMRGLELARRHTLDGVLSRLDSLYEACEAGSARGQARPEVAAADSEAR